jgi:hypothetical protein
MIKFIEKGIGKAMYRQVVWLCMIMILSMYLLGIGGQDIDGSTGQVILRKSYPGGKIRIKSKKRGCRNLTCISSLLWRGWVRYE